MWHTSFKECMSDYVTNYNYVGDTKISVSIKKLMPTNAIKRDISNWNIKIILNSSKEQVIQNYNLPVECNNLN